MSVYSEIRPEIRALAQHCVDNSRIDPELYTKYDVKRGLRDLNCLLYTSDAADD